MIFTETKLSGAYVIDLERFEDERGFFATNWSAKEFAARGLEALVAEKNISFNKHRGTLRGMHYQQDPYGQAKLVSCTRGAIYDVIIDLRTSSPTMTDWFGVELTADNYRMLYIPVGFAHGFQTLLNDTDVSYQMSSVYVPGSGAGVRWNDPEFKIDWPLAVTQICERDNTYPDLSLRRY
jgi:dTDP-4-dehydrorhamnose 3,5-epimerase